MVSEHWSIACVALSLNSLHAAPKIHSSFVSSFITPKKKEADEKQNRIFILYAFLLYFTDMDSCYDMMPSALSRHSNIIGDINCFLTTSGTNASVNNAGCTINADSQQQQQQKPITSITNINRHLITTRMQSPTDSDIDIDDSNVKDEPLSPDSSCPSTPSSPQQHYDININLANMAAYTHTDLVLEHHKVIICVSYNSKYSLLSMF